MTSSCSLYHYRYWRTTKYQTCKLQTPISLDLRMIETSFKNWHTQDNILHNIFTLCYIHGQRVTANIAKILQQRKFPSLQYVKLKLDIGLPIFPMSIHSKTLYYGQDFSDKLLDIPFQVAIKEVNVHY